MKHTLQIRLSNSEGAVIRALGLIERRGYRLDKCTVSEAGDSGRAMEVTVTSARPGDLLKRQLDRLHDVLSVELKPAANMHKTTTRVRPISRRI